MKLLQHLTLDLDGWEALKKIISNPTLSQKILLVDEPNRVIVAEIENSLSIIGYIYPQYQDVKDDFIYSILYDDLKKQYDKMMEIIKVNNYKSSFTMMIVSPLRLSSYPDFDFSKLPSKIPGYTYLSEYPNLDKNKFSLKLDEQIWKYNSQNL